MEIYINKIMPAIVSSTEDVSEWYGSTVTTDIAVLQAISKRVHMGKHVAEVKFQSSQKQEFIKAIQARDRDKLWELITHQEVEDRLLERISLKASTYGQDIEKTGATQTFKVSPSVIRDIYRDFIITLTKDVQIQYLLQRLDGVEVSFVGPVGSTSSLAVYHYFGDFQGLKTLPENSIESVFRSVVTGSSVFGIVPYHNSLGQIRETTALLITTPVKVYGEITVPVHYHLFGTAGDGDLKKIKKVYGHPASLQHCSTWLNKHLSHVQLIATSEFPVIDETSAVLANTHVGHSQSLRVIAKNIQDSTDQTRFLVISKHYLRTPTGNDVTLVLFEVNHKPGSLSSALATFAKHGVSLLSIESRPVLPEEKRQVGGIFRFLVELIGHAEDVPVKAALEELIGEYGSNINIVGSFQQGKIVNDPEIII
eukprot:TRINITY_DN2426_c0_g1_i2.p1 TRINITY_DN2426_c0_g1~~TRINITY_DN2426_c0_g1_i2.p1  ORF type:complete len:424 (-),score=92.49 TRINITY_DN2426_c0_g1_i2:36-1307(-)